MDRQCNFVICFSSHNELHGGDLVTCLSVTPNESTNQFVTFACEAHLDPEVEKSSLILKEMLMIS